MSGSSPVMTGLLVQEIWCPLPDSNRHAFWAHDFKSCASTCSAKGASLSFNAYAMRQGVDNTRKFRRESLQTRSAGGFCRRFAQAVADGAAIGGEREFFRRRGVTA